MGFETVIHSHFQRSVERFEQSPAIRLLLRGGFTPRHYASLLRQIFHQARENPQLQALATVEFRGPRRDAVRGFLRHAASEVDHDKLARSDLEVLGEDVSELAHERPLPATTALTAYAFFQIRNLNPVGYLGYLYFLEHLPTLRGATYAASLAGTGIPQESMSFLTEHATVDVAHNKLMQRYIAELVRTENDLASTCYAIDTTAYLYGAMIDQAVSVDDWEPMEIYGAVPEELGEPILQS